jgi:hypothetical protein
LTFLFHARGSLLELETQISLAEQFGDLSEFSSKSLLRGAAAVGSALTGLINSLKATISGRVLASGR